MKKNLAIAAIIPFLLLMGCKEKVKPGSAEVRRQAVAGVTVTMAKPSQVDEYYETSGTVKAKTTSLVASRVMGTVTSISTKEGDRVRAGQVLMTLDDRDMAQKVAAGEAGYNEALKAREAAAQNRSLADATYRRYKSLYDEKALTGQELDQVETQKKVADIEYERTREMVNRAKAGLAEAQVYHGFTRVTAPISGVVTEKKIESGSMAVPGVPVITVEDTSGMRVEVFADENLSGRIKAGMAADIILDAIGREAKGVITEVVPSVDPLSRTFLVKISATGTDLKSGLSAKVRIPVGRRQALLVPRSSIVERGQLTGVFTVDERGVISYRLIRLGKGYGGDVEILSGLNPKDRVITAGTEKAVDGGILEETKTK